MNPRTQPPTATGPRRTLDRGQLRLYKTDDLFDALNLIQESLNELKNKGPIAYSIPDFDCIEIGSIRNLLKKARERIEETLDYEPEADPDILEAGIALARYHGLRPECDLPIPGNPEPETFQGSDTPPKCQ